jgi:hypothetical protein
MKTKKTIAGKSLLMVLFAAAIVSGIDLQNPKTSSIGNHRVNSLNALRMAMFLPSLAATEEGGSSCNASTTCKNDSVLTCSAKCTSEQGLAFCESDIWGIACGCGEDITTTECP